MYKIKIFKFLKKNKQNILILYKLFITFTNFNFSA